MKSYKLLMEYANQIKCIDMIYFFNQKKQAL